MKVKTRIRLVIKWLREAIDATAQDGFDPAGQRGELVVKPSVVYGLEAVVEMARLSILEETRDTQEAFLAHIAGLVADLRNGPRVRTAETFTPNDRDALRSLLIVAEDSLPTAEMLDRLKAGGAVLAVVNPAGFPPATTPDLVPAAHAFLAGDPWRGLADLVDLRRDISVYDGDATVHAKPGIKSLFLGCVVPLEAPPGIEVYRVPFDKAMDWQYGSKSPREALTDLAFEETKALPLQQMEQDWADAEGDDFWDAHWLALRPDGQDMVVHYVDDTAGLCPHGQQPAECEACRVDAQLMYDWEKRVPFWMAGLEPTFERCPHGEDPVLCNECRGGSPDAAEATSWETPCDEEVAHA
jgi:hypothetical protein